MSKDTFVISRKTDVHTDNMANPVLKNAVDILQRDIQKVTTGEADANQITLVLKKMPIKKFLIRSRCIMLAHGKLKLLQQRPVA